jgi:hypothetical protein
MLRKRIKAMTTLALAVLVVIIVSYAKVFFDWLFG